MDYAAIAAILLGTVSACFILKNKNKNKDKDEK